MSSLSRLRAVPVAVALLAASSACMALDYSGYFRAGPGATSKNAARACYNLGISGGHYRLGNECDFYGEFALAHTGAVDDVKYKAEVMLNQYNSGSDVGGSSTSFHQMYLEGKGFDFAPGTNFWIGKRFYGRSDVHILDLFVTRLDGVGAGADQIDVGNGAKLGVSFFNSDTGVGYGDPGNGLSDHPGQRVNVDLSSIKVNEGGALRLTGTYTRGNFDNAGNGKGTSGLGLGVQHEQKIEAIGGSNSLWLQYAQGSAGLDGNFGTPKAPTSVKKWRVVESANWQRGNFGGQAVAIYGHQGRDAVNAVAAYREASVGGRISYALSKNFKLLGEVGHMEKRPDNAPTQKLTKLTIAPTLSTGPGFWKRPELRLYVTTAKWNDAANAAAGAGGLTGLGNGKTSGTSYGAQVEMWF